MNVHIKYKKKQTRETVGILNTKLHTYRVPHGDATFFFSIFQFYICKIEYIRIAAHFKRTAQLINRTKTYYVKRLMRNKYFDGLIFLNFFLVFSRLHCASVENENK